MSRCSATQQKVESYLSDWYSDLHACEYIFSDGEGRA